MRPGGGPPDSPGWTVRVVPNLYPALAPDAEPPPRRGRTPTCSPPRPAAGRARGDHQRARSPWPRWSSCPASRWRRRSTSGASGCAPTPGRGLRARDGQRAPRGRLLAAPHPRPALRARLRSRRRGARARALRRPRHAHDGPKPARGPRPGGGAPARAHRGDRRRGRAALPLRRPSAVPADARAAPPPRALRGRRTVRRRPAARRAGAPRAPARREPAAEPVGALRAARRRALVLAHRHRAPATHIWPGSSSAPACTSTSWRPSAPPPSCATRDRDMPSWP